MSGWKWRCAVCTMVHYWRVLVTYKSPCHEFHDTTPNYLERKVVVCICNQSVSLFFNGLDCTHHCIFSFNFSWCVVLMHARLGAPLELHSNKIVAIQQGSLQGVSPLHSENQYARWEWRCLVDNETELFRYTTTTCWADGIKLRQLSQIVLLCWTINTIIRVFFRKPN